MPQQSPMCAGSIHVCLARATRLNADGTVAPGPNNSYVTNHLMSVGFNPVIEAGDDKTLVGGCDTINLSYRGYDKLKRFDLSMARSMLEPALEEMMLGGTVILDTSVIPVPIGFNFPNQLSASQPHQPPVALELWSDAWVDDHQQTGAAANGPGRYIKWLFPMTFWRMDNSTIQNDFFQPMLAGFTRGNPSFATGNVYGDDPAGVAAQIGAFGSYFETDTLPVAACGYRTVGSS